MTNFFEELEKLMPNFCAQISIAKKGEQITVMFQMDPLGKTDKESIPYLEISGTVQELNENFFTKVREPLEEAAASFDNIDEFKKKIKEVEADETKEKNSKSTSSKKPEKKKEKQKVKVKVTADDHIKKAEEFFAVGKFKNALERYKKALELSKDKKQKESIKESISICNLKIVAARELADEPEELIEPIEDEKEQDEPEEDSDDKEEESDDDDDDSEEKETFVRSVLK